MANEELHRAYYAIITADVRYDCDLTPNAKLLYGEITALCCERGYCWATNDYFANLYGVSKTSISKWINILVQKRYIASELTYVEGTKQIDKRILRIVNTPIEEKFNTPIEEKFNTPIEEKFKENNTIIFNNTNININKEKKSIKRKESEDVFGEKVFEHWNSKKIIVHQKITQQYRDLIAKTVKTYGYDEVLCAIDRYSDALQDETYKNCKYKWTLSQFLKQSNALPDFLNEGSKWLNYKEYLDKNQPQKSQKYANPFKTIDGTQYGATDEELSFYDKYCKI